jgi:hypothetical protein
MTPLALTGPEGSNPVFINPAVSLKRILLAFWAVWMTTVFITNVFDACKAAGLLGLDWAFASGNYRFVAETTARYGTPTWVNGMLFSGVICWEGAAALLFWLAWWKFRGRRSEDTRPHYAAFTAGLTLWAAFLIADELFIAYAVAATHLRLFAAQLLSLMAIELLPEESRSAS